jgi:hypothetical protein
VEDRLTATGTDVDEHAVVLEAGAARHLRDEVEHSLRLVGGELGDVAERVDVPFRDDQQMSLRLWVDVPDRDETVSFRNGISLVEERAEKAVVRQRGSPLP